MKKILFVASECVPFIKTGGLADVVGTLPKMFDKSKFDVRVVLPSYTCIPWEYRGKFKYITHFYMEMGWFKEPHIDLIYITPNPSRGLVASFAGSELSICL